VITAGIDVGAEMVKVVLWQNGDKGKVLANHSSPSGRDKAKSSRETFAEALKIINLKQDQVKHILATGSGNKRVAFASGQITAVAAIARGVTYLFPSARTIIDVGAEEARAIKCDAQGKVLDFTVNERCAAGAGAFVKTIAVALEVPVEEMGELSRKATTEVPVVNAQCTVFAESEVVSLIQDGATKEDIASAVLNALAGRIGAMVRVMRVENDVVLIGGLARNNGFIDCLKRTLEVNLLVPQLPEFVSALGAALATAR
jgi:benzoyl-CoA reductase subunit D